MNRFFPRKRSFTTAAIKMSYEMVSTATLGCLLYDALIPKVNQSNSRVSKKKQLNEICTIIHTSIDYIMPSYIASLKEISVNIRIHIMFRVNS
jgi:hypothetical protein